MAQSCVFLIDFDNVFGGLWKLDRNLAKRFAREPDVWLQRLRTHYLAGDERRWLVLRCYLNPAGFVEDEEGEQGRLYFSRFRPAWLSAGFEVVDCPALTRQKKNAADIRIVIDALDLLGHRTRFDEFVIASADADFTPLLQRIRADDRHITVLSSQFSSRAFSSIADRYIDDRGIEALTGPDVTPVAEPIEPAAGADAWAGFAAVLARRYEEASAPINLAALAQSIGRECPDAVRAKWFGLGFAGAIARAGLPRVRLSQHFLWDDERHQEPVGADMLEEDELPPVIEMLVRNVGLPRIDRAVWPELFQALAEYAASQPFNLTESTRWTRERLAERKLSVARGAIAFVVRGTQFGGEPLTKVPPPSGEDIANAFLSNLIAQVGNSGFVLDDAEEDAIAEWLGFNPETDEPEAADEPAEPEPE